MIPTFSSQYTQRTYKLTARGIGASMQLLQLHAGLRWSHIIFIQYAQWATSPPRFLSGNYRSHLTKYQREWVAALTNYNSAQSSQKTVRTHAVQGLCIPKKKSVISNAVDISQGSRYIDQRSLQPISMARSSILGRPENNYSVLDKNKKEYGSPRPCIEIKQPKKVPVYE